MSYESLKAILPKRLRSLDAASVTEIRLRLDRPPRLYTASGFRDWEGTVTEGDLTFVLNAASRYSPWNAETMAEGYLTASGGHRIGVCGDGVRTISSLCIRVARDVTGIARGLPMEENLLILGPPGFGKTTLLRDLIRAIPDPVSVVDERRELFPEGFPRGNADVLWGVPKGKGIDMVLRAMGPKVIAMDEVTSQADCEALTRAAWCGVRLLATAHAASVEDLKTRSVYTPLVRAGIFHRAVVLGRNFDWTLQEVEQ